MGALQVSTMHWAKHSDSRKSHKKKVDQVPAGEIADQDMDIKDYSKQLQTTATDTTTQRLLCPGACRLI
ncbi:hypothetical protein [Candidatus Sororendozoicomonas aggregata]|uniref:hypothetical protein n=1 Tax=Candidatus Sororendozoicomonas aggregata TaxID=3073239 RepID=UPI002ED44D55